MKIDLPAKNGWKELRGGKRNTYVFKNLRRLPEQNGKNHFLKDKMNSVRPSDAFMHPDPSVLAFKEDGFRSE